jgi:hypothetical protein
MWLVASQGTMAVKASAPQGSPTGEPHQAVCSGQERRELDLLGGRITTRQDLSCSVERAPLARGGQAGESPLMLA